MNQPRQKAQDPLNLQSLPLLEPPRDGWPVIEAALRSDHKRRNGARYAGLALAAAASVTLAIGLALQKPVSPAPERSAETALAQDQQPEQPTSGEARQAPVETLQTMIAMSQQLENRLRTIRSGAGDLPAGAIVYQIELEDLVAQVDDELSNRPDSLALWSQRVSLLMDLEQLYENQLRREYRQMASL